MALVPLESEPRIQILHVRDNCERVSDPIHSTRSDIIHYNMYFTIATNDGINNVIYTREVGVTHDSPRSES